MKNSIYTFFLLVFPLIGFAQFEDFTEIEYVATGDNKTLSYEVFPCNLDTKVIVERTASKGENLNIEFMSYDNTSIEKHSLAVGKSVYIKSFGLKDHLVILMGTEGGVYEGSILTNVVVVSYDDYKLVEMGENTVKGKYKPAKAGSFMSTRRASSFREVGSAIAFEDRGELTLLNLETKKIVPVDLKLKMSHLVYNFIPSNTAGVAHILTARNGNMNGMEILKINPNGKVLESHVIDQGFTKGINTSSISFYEDAGNYYAAGLTMGLANVRITGVRFYSFVNGKKEVKNFGFSSKEFLGLSEDVDNSDKSKVDYSGECSVYRSNGKTFILNKFYEVKITGNQNTQRVTKTWKKINCVQLDSENRIIDQTSFPFEGVSGTNVRNFSASYNPQNSTIHYFSSDAYSYSGILMFSYDTENNVSSSKMLLGGYVAYSSVIDNSHLFVYGLFKDGEPYALQLSAEDAEAKTAYGILEF